MLICFVAAMFRLLSERLAGVPSDAARIAAQFIPGIGASTRGMISGLTTARSIFAGALVAMAAGGGLYRTALFPTAFVLGSLFVLGYAEQNFNVKPLLTGYEVTGARVDQISQEVNRILGTHNRGMQNGLTSNTGQHVRLRFGVEGCSGAEHDLFHEFKASTALQGAVSLGRVEHE